MKNIILGIVGTSVLTSQVFAFDLQDLKKMAFERCQSPYVKTEIVPVPLLDPSPDSLPGSVGMVYQEELSVHTANLLDRNDFYFSPRPRAAVNSLPMEIYVDKDGSGNYTKQTWEDAHPDYTNPTIQPPIDRNAIPEAGRVLTELIIGHKSPDGGYPQLFDLRSSAYVRFAGYPPQVTGASLRLGAHNIFSMGPTGKNDRPEDFPVIRSMYVSLKDSKTANALVLVENQLSCSAMSLDMIEGANAEIVVDSHMYTRRDFNWKNEPHSGLVAYSSMSFKTEVDTPERSTDEAHDSDMLTVKYADGTMDRVSIHGSFDHVLKIRDLTSDAKKAAPTEWILANEDRDPAHYADFQPALGDTNYHLRASYNVQILESNIKTGVTLYEASADGEYGDNIVAVSTIREDIKKAKSVDESVHFKYRTKAFFPN